MSLLSPRRLNSQIGGGSTITDPGIVPLSGTITFTGTGFLSQHNNHHHDSARKHSDHLHLTAGSGNFTITATIPTIPTPPRLAPTPSP
jgi:hypothetical protein